MILYDGDDELEPFAEMMAMTVCTAIADSLEVNIEDVTLGAELINDLGMTEEKQQTLTKNIMALFDDLIIDYKPDSTVRDLVHQVLIDDLETTGFEENLF